MSSIRTLLAAALALSALTISQAGHFELDAGKFWVGN